MENRAEQPTRHSGSIVSKVNELKIRHLKNFEPIKEQLRYVFVLIGLKTLPSKQRPGEGIPSEEDVLLNFIRQNYGGYHPAEIRAAFELAVTGKIEIKPDDIKHYGNFSCEYFSRIMRAYEPYRRGAIKKQTDSKKNIPESTKMTPKEKFEHLEKHLIKPYEEWVGGGDWPFSEIQMSLNCQNLRRIGIQPISDEEGVRLKAQIKKDFRLLADKSKIEMQTNSVCKKEAFRSWCERMRKGSVDVSDLIYKKICQ